MLSFDSRGLDNDGLPDYCDIKQNEFLYRRHKKQKEEDVVICECKYDVNDPGGACGERCLNFLTSTECTPGYCPCGIYCKNQRFQKCEYAKTRLFKTEGRGWGLIADENIMQKCRRPNLINITDHLANFNGSLRRRNFMSANVIFGLPKAGQFIIEYCGEVISWKEAKRRSQAYENQGLKDAFIISLNASESIDATKKGSFARFINHSCNPNCETRKWNVLGEIRVGIFAKEDMSMGTELAYDYNFEWYGGTKVRCLCGATSCSGFLGAKSRGFQEDTYVWEDDDQRYSVEKIPLYDSAEDEPKLLVNCIDFEYNAYMSNENPLMVDDSMGTDHQSHSTMVICPFGSALEGIGTNEVKTEVNEEMKPHSQDTQQAYPQQNAMISRIRSNTACRNYQIGPRSVPKKRSKQLSNGRLKQFIQKPVDAKAAALLLASKAAQEEILTYEEVKNEAASELDALYDEIRPAIEEYERDSQDSVATSVAEKWIQASCSKLKAEFDLYATIIRNIACTPPASRTSGSANAIEGGNNNGVNLLTN